MPFLRRSINLSIRQSEAASVFVLSAATGRAKAPLDMRPVTATKRAPQRRPCHKFPHEESDYRYFPAAEHNTVGDVLPSCYID